MGQYPVQHCEDGWVYNAEEDACYWFEEERLIWMDAEAKCVEKGAHLTSVNSEDELQFLRGKNE